MTIIYNYLNKKQSSLRVIMIYSPRYLVEPVMLFFMYTYIMQLIFYSGIFQADVWYEQTKNESLVRFNNVFFAL